MGLISEIQKSADKEQLAKCIFNVTTIEEGLDLVLGKDCEQSKSILRCFKGKTYLDCLRVFGELGD